MILLGSKAAQIIGVDLGRKPSDVDFLCTLDEFLEWHKQFANFPVEESSENKKHVKVFDTHFEFEIVQNDHSSKILYDFILNDERTIKSESFLVPHLNVLFALKKSHRYRKNSPHFWKTFFDYHKMKMIGAYVDEGLEEFVKLRAKEVAKAVPKLNVTKKDFFKDDNINYVYDHDSIHVSIALDQVPAYTHYLMEGQEVFCDKKKFEALDYQTRLNGVIEEACVLAIERSLVPFGCKDEKNPKKAWVFALSKVMSSITSGWFREFAYENGLQVLKQYPENYWNKFEQDLQLGKIKPFAGSKY